MESGSTASRGISEVLNSKVVAAVTARISSPGQIIDSVPIIGCFLAKV